MKLYHVKTTAVITLGNGTKAYASVIFSVSGSELENQIYRIKRNATISFREDDKIELVGEVYGVDSHPATEFMGFKFAPNTIYKVIRFCTDNLEIYTDKDCYNIGCDKKEIVDKFLKDLNIK